MLREVLFPSFPKRWVFGLINWVWAKYILLYLCPFQIIAAHVSFAETSLDKCSHVLASFYHLCEVC